MGEAEVNWAYFLETRVRGCVLYRPKIQYGANCVCAQLRDKFSKRAIANALFIKSGEQVSLTIFDDKLITLHNLFTNQMLDFNDENVTTLLLSVEAILFYNKKLNVTSGKQRITLQALKVGGKHLTVLQGT